MLEACCYHHESIEYKEEDVGIVPGRNPELMAANEDSQDRMVRKAWTSFVFGNVEYKFCTLDEGLVYIKKIKGKIVEVELVDLNTDATHNPPAPLSLDE